MFVNVAEKLGALKSNSKRQIFLPVFANIVAKFRAIRVFPVPPLNEWRAIITTVFPLAICLFYQSFHPKVVVWELVEI